MFVPQSGVAVLEVDHDLAHAKSERVKAELSAIGLRCIILPVGVTLSHVAQCGMDDEDDE